MSMTSAPPGKGVYTATDPDWDWLRNVQKKLYERSWEEPNYVFRELWGLITDLHNLRIALHRVSHNKGRRTAGIDGVTVRKLLNTEGPDAFVERVKVMLRGRTYSPSPVRRVKIPKPGKPGEFRPLGIPTVTDRVVQSAIKNIVEPIFEADFFPVSYGFRPGRGVHGALEHLRLALRPRAVTTGKEPERRLPYQWAIEGDIKGCFDNISHHGLMNRLRRRIRDGKLNRLILAFLKAGILSEEQFLRSDSGVPQGGIFSPILANVALSVIEERYEDTTWPRKTPTLELDRKEVTKRSGRERRKRRRQGKPVFLPIRYADDFLILVSVPPGPGQDERARREAEQEKVALAQQLKEELNLELSEEKTLITPVTEPMRFLGHRVSVKEHRHRKVKVSTTRIPKEKGIKLRETVKRLLKRNRINLTLETIIGQLNPVLRGWANFYRHAWGAKQVFSAIDNYVWWSLYRWLRKKHPNMARKRLVARFAERKSGRGTLHWGSTRQRLFQMTTVKVEWYHLGWLRPPHFATKIYGEPGA
jgi:group II intron reverse transcriptase/maturase